MKKIWNIILREIAGMKAIFASNIVVSVLASVSYLGLTFAIQQIMSVANGESQEPLSSVSIIAVVMLIYYAAMNIFSEIVSSKFEISLEKSMRMRQITTLFHKSFLSVGHFHSGALLNRLTEDVRLVASFIVNISNQFILETLTAILAILYMFLLNWQITLIMLVIIPVLTFSITRFAPVLQRLSDQNLQSDDKIKSFVQDILNQLALFKLYGMREKTENSLNALYNDKRSVKMKLAKCIGLFSFMNSFMSFGVFIITLIVGAFFSLRGDLQISEMIAIVQLTNYVSLPISNFSRWVSESAMARAASERISEIETLEDEKAQRLMNDSHNLQQVIIKDLSFSYPLKKYNSDGAREEKPVIESLAVTLEKGRIIGIMGSSGSGKTTLLYLLLGLYHGSSGEILFRYNKEADDMPGNIAVGYTPSDRFLFHGTVQENICMTQPYDESHMTKILRDTNLTECIASLPDGIYTEIEENGKNLSMGQAQRIAIARTFYCNHSMMVFDEPTSNLDSESKLILQNSFKQYAKDRICIVVTHDPEMLLRCDQQYKLTNGILMEELNEHNR